MERITQIGEVIASWNGDGVFTGREPNNSHRYQMRRNLISNRQLRTFNKFLRDTYSRDHVYINVPNRFGEDLADAWIKEDLKDGDIFIYSYASCKPWFHRCAMMPIYCGIKGVSLEEVKDFRDDLMSEIRYFGLGTDVSGGKGWGIVEDAAYWFKVNVRFPFPQWHEEDRDSDVLDEDEIPLFSLDDIDEPTIGMTGNWFNEKADQFFKNSQAESKHKTAIFGDYLLKYCWHRTEPYPFLGGTGMRLKFYDSQKVLMDEVQFLPIGTYSKESNSFLWVWENPGWLADYQLNEKLKTNNQKLFDRLSKVKSLSKKYGFEEFGKSGEIEVEEFESWEFMAMACKELSADVTFMIQGDYGNTYGLIFYTDNKWNEFTQTAVTLLTKARGMMKDFLHKHNYLYHSSPVEFATEFLNSESGSRIESELEEYLSNEYFTHLLKKRIDKNANEEQRFKQVIRTLFSKHSHAQ